MKSKRPILGVLGVGHVGSAVRHWFEQKGDPLRLYDKFMKLGSLDEINEADVIFVALPTPFNDTTRRFDDSAIRENLAQLTGDKLIVVKSTVLPGTTDSYQQAYPAHRFIFSPEFMREAHAVEDFLAPARHVIGTTAQSKADVQGVVRLLPMAPEVRVMTAMEAEMVKYFANTFLATKVIFANQMFDLCKSLDLNYEVVKEAAALDPRIGPSHLHVWQDEYRGYGGHCLPKDMKALIQLAEQQGVDVTLLKTVDAINMDLQKERLHSDRPESVVSP